MMSLASTEEAILFHLSCGDFMTLKFLRGEKARILVCCVDFTVSFNQLLVLSVVADLALLQNNRFQKQFLRQGFQIEVQSPQDILGRH